MGHPPGRPHRILSENRPEWSTADFRHPAARAHVTVPVYAAHIDPGATAYTLSDSGTTVIFVSTEHQLRKVLAILPQTQIQKIVVMDHLQIPSDLAATCLLMDQFINQGPTALDARTESFARSIQPDDLATIIYTSGTTGTSKGAMLDPRQHGVQHQLFNARVRHARRPGQHFVSSPVARYRAPRGSRHAVSWRHSAYCPLSRTPSRDFAGGSSLGLRFRSPVYEKIYAKTEMTARGFPKRAIYRWGALRRSRPQARNSRGRNSHFRQLEAG